MKTKIKHLYIHVPFCNSICYYCDFCHVVYTKEKVDKWLETLQNEVKNKCFDQYETIYIGGGTPSCLNINQLEKLLSIIKPYSHEVIEYTIEVNPESIDIQKISLFKKYNINRISLGVQTSDDSLLKSLNRKHSFDDVKNSIKLLKDNDLNNISIDLMYSLPGQDIYMLNKTIDDFLNLDVPHVSLYSLTIEENSVFAKKEIKSLDIDTEADMYELIQKRLTEENYIHYEVSNYCKKGYESKHNLGYWRYDDFLGLSLGASSKVSNKRWTNTRNFNEYFTDFNSKQEDLDLSLDDLKFEHIMMSLRTIYGLNIDEFNTLYNADFINEYRCGLNNKSIMVKNSNVYCNNFEILNSVLLDFLEK